MYQAVCIKSHKNVYTLWTGNSTSYNLSSGNKIGNEKSYIPPKCLTHTILYNSRKNFLRESI